MTTIKTDFSDVYFETGFPNSLKNDSFEQKTYLTLVDIACNLVDKYDCNIYFFIMKLGKTIVLNDKTTFEYSNVLEKDVIFLDKLLYYLKKISKNDLLFVKEFSTTNKNCIPFDEWWNNFQTLISELQTLYKITSSNQNKS